MRKLRAPVSLAALVAIALVILPRSLGAVLQIVIGCAWYVGAGGSLYLWAETKPRRAPVALFLAVWTGICLTIVGVRFGIEVMVALLVWLATPPFVLGIVAVCFAIGSCVRKVKLRATEAYYRRRRATDH